MGKFTHLTCNSLYGNKLLEIQYPKETPTEEAATRSVTSGKVEMVSFDSNFRGGVKVHMSIDCVKTHIHVKWFEDKKNVMLSIAKVFPKKYDYAE